ncbi:CheR family methyltransferase [Legionella jordanis]|uniref:Methyltransferase involved in chemotaxis (CheR domain) n=1 Tax=Legionella jordanis TaxID=456 RepID=A0A0W0V806_9GAMM|nr:CheR family methyltransferase [Legionella jordanis]KTD16256.1 methyltransferase involved in chemotaxis (CheR domain) [Legionella jordanis]VEH12286.1 methyltransferase involved in chemotaxis (CheR domain) [Legionella jordanis]
MKNNKNMNGNSAVKKNKSNNKITSFEKKNPPGDELFIVAIGASAGGLETLKDMFSKSFSNNNIAFIVITHLSTEHISLLPQLLQSYTPLTVSPIRDKTVVKANHIYVLPPGFNVSIQQAVLKLHEVKSTHDLKMPIDYFLRSLANDQKQKGICVILSGTGTDGTIGLRTLREQGGLIIVQSAKSARYDGMPKSAISTGLVNYILEPEEIFPFILKYIAHLKNQHISLPDSISQEITKVLILLNDHTGHDFSLYKPNTIFRRIQKRLAILQIDNLALYIKYVQQKPMELDILFKELLINVTNFFRDPEAFDILKSIIREKVLKDKPNNYTLRVWVPGCATGEEAYSLAILLHECLEQQKSLCNVQIFGTDIDEDAIEIARAGLFSPNIVNDLSKERLARYFIKEGDSYKVSIDIRKMIIFAIQNLVKDPPFTKLDVLSCRNLLIYLNAQLQKKILPLFHYSLKPQGILFLGTSETIGGFSDLFTIIDRRWKIFERKGGASSFHSVLDLPAPLPVSEISETKTMEKNMYEVEPNLSHLVEEILLKKYTPACVIIDDKGRILYIYGRTSPFLEFPPGEVKLNFLEMVRPELRSKVSQAVRSASMEQKEVICGALQYREEKDAHYINLKVRPLKEAEAFHKKLYLIIFEEILAFEHNNDKADKSKSPDDLDKKIIQLEQELKYTKESLQTTIEELETSNEELKSSNEELQSTNEELQSTNEEIETSKEELQSLNEELTTVNAELESRIEQLSSANDDIKNLLDNTEIATVFLNKELCIKRFTPKATEIINLIASDVGRPLGHIVSNLQYDRLIDDARSVLQSLEPKTSEVLDKHGHWYVVRIIPYRTVTNIIDGVVITFLNIHDQKKAEIEVAKLKGESETLKEIITLTLNFIAEPALILQDGDKIIFANKAFESNFKIEGSALVNHSLQKLKVDWNKKLLKSSLESLQDQIKSECSNLEMFPGKFYSLSMQRYSQFIILVMHPCK